MDANIKKIDQIINEYITEVSKFIKVDKVYLYGSYAKGNFNEISDLDIAIFSDEFNGKSFVDSVSFLNSLARKYREICIEPVAFSLKDIEQDNPFVKEIIGTGKEMPLH